MDYYLRHYGILGMHWGIRRYQDYDGHRIASPEHYQKKAEKYRGKAEKYEKRSKDWIDRDYKIKANRYNKKADEAEQKAQELLEKYGDQRTGMLAELAIAASPIIVPAAISGITIAASAISDKDYRTKQTDKQLDELNLTKKYNSLSDIPKNKTTKVKDYIKDINPKFKDNKDPGSKMNCVLCTTALAMREKGYKANAQSSILGFFPKEYFSKTFKGSEYGKVKAKNASSFVSKMESLGDGAYGHLSVCWKFGGRHSLFFKNESGKLKIYDGQSGKEIKYNSDPKFFQSIRIEESHYIRLDNAEPTEKVLGAIK